MNPKNNHMQTKIYALLLIGIIVASCGEGKKDKNASLNDKKVQLEQLKKQQEGINAQVAKLQAEIDKMDTSAAAQKNIKLVSITAIQPQVFSHYIDLQGRVEAKNISYVAPPGGQPGVVKAVYVKQGDQVRQGQTLLKLDDQLIRQQIEPLKVQLSTAEDTYRRTKNLWDQGIGAYQNVLTAQTQVESLKKQIGIFEKQISLTNVTAPQSGSADIVNVRVGETFSGFAGTNPQIVIVNTGDLKVTANVPENYIGKINVGSAVDIVLPDQNNRTINAKVTVMSKAIDPSTRSFYIEAKVPAGSNLKPNQVAKVKIKDYGNSNAIAIPVEALQNDEKGKFVLVAVKEKDGLVARKRVVTVGELYGDQLEVKTGLQPGDQLITDGAQGLYDGQPVTTETK